MNAKDIAQRLAQQAERVAAHLLPNGVKQGPEWCVGSVQGEAGKSCKVRITGGNVGVWKDFASGEGGDLIDLWAKSRGITLGEAIREAADWLGVAREMPKGEPRKQYKPAEPLQTNPAAQSQVVWNYLTVTRNLGEAALKAYGVSADGDWIVFPYLRDGDLVFWKKLALERRADGKKKMISSAGAEPILFGWQAIGPLAREVVLTEGELDAITSYQYGWPALSVPTGAGGHAWIESEFDHLARFDRIYIAFDMDHDGRAGAEAVAQRLGRHRCRIVEMPRKDLNACAMAGIDDGEIETCFRAAQTSDPSELKTAGKFMDAVLYAFWPASEHEPGVEPPWPYMADRFRFRPGETTLVTGRSGHGKSQIVGQIVLHGMWSGHPACLASMEMPTRTTLKRLTSQATTLHQPSREYIQTVVRWLDDKLWLFDVVGTAKWERILEVFLYAHQRYGIGFFVIDNLAKCGIAEDDYNAQKAFIDALTDFDKSYGAHTILVAHPRKGASDQEETDNAGVRGAAALTDMVDNVFHVTRNVKKHKDISEMQAAQRQPPQDLLDLPDGKLWISKHRNGDWVDGWINLWFDPESYRFRPALNAEIRPYVGFRDMAPGGQQQMV